MKMWRFFILFAIFHFWSFKANAQFGPVWHTPNEYDSDGETCASKLPSIERVCPLYGARSVGLSQSDFQALCSSIGFHCSKNLFMDGSCNDCPEGFELVEEENDVFCRHEDGSEMYRGLTNPFDCKGDGEIARTTVGAYRPCHDNSNLKTSTVPNYYQGSDSVNELTLQSCYDDLKLPAAETIVNQRTKGEVFRFPLIKEYDNTDVEHGYLQCPLHSATYSYTSPGWLVLYAFYGVGFLSQILFYLFKRAMEAQHSSEKTEAVLDTSALATPGSTSKKSLVTQIGLRNNIFGTFCYTLVIAMSIGTQLFLFLSVMDTYGFTLNTFCRNDEAVQAACAASFASGADPTWRAGYTCASGCLFKFILVYGNHETWPYASKGGDATHNYVIWIAAWHITTVWFVVLKLLQPNLRSWFRLRARLDEADVILCSMPIEKAIRIDKEKDTKVTKILDMWDHTLSKIAGQQQLVKACDVLVFDGGLKCFDFRESRFTYHEENHHFVLDVINVGNTKHQLVKQDESGLSTEEVVRRQRVVGRNMIHVTVPSWLQALFEEFFDFFYFYQFFCMWVWFSFIYWTMGLALTIMIVASGIVKVITRRSSTKYIKQLADNFTSLDVLRDGKFVKLNSDELVPGDIIALEADMMLPADAAILRGRCVMDESSLTGELTPSPKIPLPSDDTPFIRNFEHQRHIVLAGTRVSSVTLEEGRATGIILATGVMTDKGKLIRDILFPAPVSFRFDDEWRLIFPALIVWGVLSGSVCIYFYRSSLASWYYAVVIMSQVMSPLIPAVFVAGTTRAVYQLKKKKLFCSVPHRLLLAGKLKIFCFDKTGTLTKAGLSFRGVCPVDANNQMLPPVYEGLSALPHLKTLLGTCHENDWIEESDGSYKIVGNKLDAEMFENSGCTMVSGGINAVFDCGGVEYLVLKRFEFDRKTMSMSVLVENRDDKKRYVFCKGSCESIVNILKCGSAPSNLDSTVVQLAVQGYYTIALAAAEYTGTLDPKLLDRTMIENDLELRGLMIFQNSVKEDAADMIQELKEGKIRSVMVTGDYALTALKVAREINMSTANNVFVADMSSDGKEVVWTDYDSGKEIKNPKIYLKEMQNGDVELAVNAKSFNALNAIKQSDGTSEMKTLMPYTRIFSRMRPEQKVEVVELCMHFGITGMCGDGANDAGALRTAHCGIALADTNADISIVAPLSCASRQLSTVTDLVKEGRCILANAIAGYKALIVYGEILAFSSLATFYFGAVASEAFWITWDSFVTAGMAWCLLQARPADRLTPNRPTSKLLGKETVISLTLQILCNWFWVTIAVVYLFQQDWFRCHEYDQNTTDQGLWFLKGSNYEAAIISIISSYQFASAAPVNSIGFDYRQSWWRNYSLLIYYIFWLIFYASLILPGPWFLNCLFLFNCGDRSLIEHWVSVDLLPPSTPYPISMPQGCSCDSQVIPNHPLCEAEYSQPCPNYSYNQIFHHNLLLNNSNFVFFSFMVANVVFLFIGEGIIVTGPIRRYLRKLKYQKNIDHSNNLVVGKIDRSQISVLFE